MKKSAYGEPIIIESDTVTSFKKSSDYDERTIQDLIYDYPSTIPISDIDESYNPIVPVCKELNTPSGPIDIFMITPNGDILIIETKLWRNPEARRKVVAQILDYAKEIAKWSYEDLQREINRKLKLKGNSLYELCLKSQQDSTLGESDFVDAVSRNLRLGKFLLLIVGDGIKEGAKGIAEFLNRGGNLHFNLAMVELSIYKNDREQKLIIPNTIVRTVEIERINIELPVGFSMINSSDEKSTKEEINSGPTEEIIQRRKLHTKLWTELVSELEFDDPGQPLPSIAKGANIYVYPGNTKFCWISAYYAQSYNRIGVYFRFQQNNIGRSIKEHLEEFKDDIKNEIGNEVIWNWDEDDRSGFVIRKTLDDVYSDKNKPVVKEFFKYYLNHFVNVIRPKLKDL